jgi:ABC-2 type transport system permease protein
MSSTHAPASRPREVAPEGAVLDPGHHHGPSAFGGDLRRFVNLTTTLATTDFKLKYFGSALGYLWSLVRPMLFFGVIYVMFTLVFNAGKGVPHYPVYLLSSIMLFTFFGETTSNCVGCLLAREGLLRKIRFPRLAIPAAVSLTALFTLCTNFIAVLIFAAAEGISPKVSWLELPLLILLLATLAIGTGMLLSVLYVRFRDIQPIWEVISQVLFYGSPIIYVAAKYKDVVRIAMCNPIAAILTQMRHAFIDPRAHDAATYIGGAVRLLIPLAIIVSAFALGLWFFSREAPRIAERL